MALFDGTNCYCENVPPEDKGASRDDELGCNDSCPADVTQICGDGGNSRHSSVYRINSVPPPNACAGRTPPPAIVFGHSSGNTGLGMSGGFSGSIAQIQLFTRNLGTDEIECLFNFGQSEVKTCKAAVMLPGVQYFQTFLPPEVDYATDFSTKYWGGNGRTASRADGRASARQTPSARAPKRARGTTSSTPPWTFGCATAPTRWTASTGASTTTSAPSPRVTAPGANRRAPILSN